MILALACTIGAGLFFGAWLLSVLADFDAELPDDDEWEDMP